MTGKSSLGKYKFEILLILSLILFLTILLYNFKPSVYTDDEVITKITYNGLLNNSLNLDTGFSSKYNISDFQYLNGFHRKDSTHIYPATYFGLPLYILFLNPIFGFDIYYLINMVSNYKLFLTALQPLA